MDRIAQYSSYDLIHLISPRPLLMIHGTDADTARFSREAIEKVREPKELFWIEGASHVDLYDKEEYVPTAIAKLSDFFQEHLTKTRAQLAAHQGLAPQQPGDALAISDPARASCPSRVSLVFTERGERRAVSIALRAFAEQAVAVTVRPRKTI